MMLENNLNGPVTTVQVIGNNPTANFPLEQYGLYAQDDWRVTSRADAQSRRPLGLRGRLSDRPDRQRELPGHAAGGCGRPVRRDAARRFRQGSASGPRQRAAASRRGDSTCSATAGTSCAAAGGCIRTSDTSRQTRSPRRSTPSTPESCSWRPTTPVCGKPTDRSSTSAIPLEHHRLPQYRRRRPAAGRRGRVSGARAAVQPSGQPGVVASARRLNGRQRRLRARGWPRSEPAGAAERAGQRTAPALPR